MNKINNSILADKRVLILDGNERMQRVITYTLNKIVTDAVIVSTPKQTLEYLNTDECRTISVLLVNISGHEKEYMEFCKQVRLNYNKTQMPIMVLSVDTNAQSITDIFEIGCNDFICIPFNDGEFVARINTLMEIKRLSEQNTKLKEIMDIRTQVFKMNTHDLKNPLSAIFSLSGISVESFSGNEEIIQTFSVIHNASKVMMSLINDNLEFLQISSADVHMENALVDVVSVMNQIYEMNNPLAKDKQQTIILDFTTEDCFIYSDGRKIYQAINNIVSNAIKFSPNGKRIWFSVYRDEENINIVVQDEGQGFKKHEVDTVFTQFGKHSATPTGDEISTGLGMLITKQLISLTNGSIKLESEEGKGSKFTITLQAVSPDSI